MTPPVAVLEQPPTPTSPTMHTHVPPTHRMDRFTTRVRQNFLQALTPEMLQIVSARLRSEYRGGCQTCKIGMLPSFCHTLPDGLETGSFLALDVGGSTLRVALVHLNGRNTAGAAISILRSRHHVIDRTTRGLVGRAFFAWMADRIYETLDGDERWLRAPEPLRIGLAWSFPIEQTSIRDGLLMQMGKGFRAVDGLMGENLADLVSDACLAKRLNVEVEAIVNDSSSSLLSGAYLSGSSPIALILGTGLNATVDLSVSAIASNKFGVRPAAWYEAAQRVLTNTELSLFGRNVFLITRWDHELNERHSTPDFQPLEYLTSGRYLGEIARLVLLDAIKAASLFDGRTPSNFEAYSLTTETIAVIERDNSPTLSRAQAVMIAKHPLPGDKRYSLADLTHMRHIINAISSRAAAYIATAVHALCAFKFSYESSTPTREDIVIACNGSVLEKYPDFLTRTQEWLDILTSSNPTQRRIRLELTGESVLSGAAIAVACQTR